MEKKECKCGCNCSCVSWRITMVLVLCGLIWGACLGTCAYKKIDAMYKIIIEMSYGSEEGFNKVYDAVMTDTYKEQIKNQIDAQVESMNASNDENYEVEEEEDIEISWEEFEATSAEAYNLFGLSGTPGNAIVNKKTGAFKAVGGAYPQETIEAAVAAVRDGSAQSDDVGNAGTLTQDQINGLLDGVYYKDDNSKAEIIIIEYSDLLCPYCKRHYNNRTLENIVEADNSVALVFKNMPIKSLHPTAPVGARWVECAWKIGGAEAYYKFLDAAFAEDKFTSSNVLAIANKLWLNESEFTECFNN